MAAVLVLIKNSFDVVVLVLLLNNLNACSSTK